MSNNKIKHFLTHVKILEIPNDVEGYIYLLTQITIKKLEGSTCYMFDVDLRSHYLPRKTDRVLEKVSSRDQSPLLFSPQNSFIVHIYAYIPTIPLSYVYKLISKLRICKYLKFWHLFPSNVFTFLKHIQQ